MSIIIVWSVYFRHGYLHIILRRISCFILNVSKNNNFIYCNVLLFLMAWLCLCMNACSVHPCACRFRIPATRAHFCYSQYWSGCLSYRGHNTPFLCRYNISVYRIEQLFNMLKFCVSPAICVWHQKTHGEGCLSLLKFSLDAWPANKGAICNIFITVSCWHLLNQQTCCSNNL